MSRQEKPSFADLVKVSESKANKPSARLEPIVMPFADREYVDAAGGRWRRRGLGAIDEKRFHRLFADPAVTVLHLYLWDSL